MRTARQVRYDRARQRFLDRELDPDDLDVVLNDTWSDYDGNSIYADWTFDSQVVKLRSYIPGLAINDQLAGGGAANTTYLHTNALGSTMATSNSSGVGTFDAAYRAFGEQIMGPKRRYGFAGEWGYQSNDEFDFLHFGARYYNPETGRFTQRDPIGISGGDNVYRYVKNQPTVSLDPAGLIGAGGGGDNHYYPPRLPKTWKRKPGDRDLIMKLPEIPDPYKKKLVRCAGVTAIGGAFGGAAGAGGAAMACLFCEILGD